MIGRLSAGPHWISAAFYGLVAPKGFLMFLQSECGSACGESGSIVFFASDPFISRQQGQLSSDCHVLSKLRLGHYMGTRTNSVAET